MRSQLTPSISLIAVLLPTGIKLSFSIGKGGSNKAETIKEGIAEQISELPLSVSFVKQEEGLIRAAQTAHYWAKADEDAYDELIRRQLRV